MHVFTQSMVKSAPWDKSIKGLQVQLIAQVAFERILFGKCPLTNSYT